MCSAHRCSWNQIIIMHAFIHGLEFYTVWHTWIKENNVNRINERVERGIASSWIPKTCDTAPGSTIFFWYGVGNVRQWRSSLFGILLTPAGLMAWFIAHLIVSQRKAKATKGTATTIPLWPQMCQETFSSFLFGDKWEMSDCLLRS